MHTGINSFLNNFIIFFILVSIILLTLLLRLVLVLLSQIVLMTHLKCLLEGPIFLVVVLLIILGLLKVLFVIVSGLRELRFKQLRLNLVVERVVEVFEIEVVRGWHRDWHLLFRVAFIKANYPRFVSWSCFTSFF